MHDKYQKIAYAGWNMLVSRLPAKRDSAYLKIIIFLA